MVRRSRALDRAPFAERSDFFSNPSSRYRAGAAGAISITRRKPMARNRRQLSRRIGWIMRQQSLVIAFLTTMSLGASLDAQRTWNVDEANGVGTDFTDLPPALLAATHGDTILIRKGAYTPGSTNKGVSLLGEPGAVLRSSLGTFRVAGLPRGRTFVMKGLSNFATT